MFGFRKRRFVRRWEDRYMLEFYSMDIPVYQLKCWIRNDTKHVEKAAKQLSEVQAYYE